MLVNYFKKGMEMTKKGFITLHYLISGEESRMGQQDYWRHVFLSQKPPFYRRLLELSKVTLVVAASFMMTMAVSIL